MRIFLNNKVLKTIPIIFLIIILLKVTYSYFEIKEREYNFAKKEAEVLNSYATENRAYYQNLFLDGTLALNEKTLPALPPLSSHTISENFSKNNPLNITVAIVSDRARNSENQANDEEMKAIEFFKNNLDEKVYFSSENPKFYQHAAVLRVEQICLNCHGKKEQAPLFIQKNYQNAYDYKLGEVIGILSIQIPSKNLNTYFFKNFIESITYDILLFLLLFLGVIFLMKKSREISATLKKNVKEKTKELKESFLFDRLTNLPNRLKLMEDIKNSNDLGSSHLALINIDSFKDINDLYGFGVGDEILVQVSKRIREFCEYSNFVYKLPNDEFAIFTTSQLSQEKFLESIKEMLHKIGETKFGIADQSVFITFSCGIASNKESLLIKTNTALQIAKRNSKNIVIYNDSLNAKKQILENMDALLILKNAIKYDQITPFYQAIYNTKTKKIDKYEVLARIVTKSKEVILPFVFLDIAVKSKLYPQITKAIITKSFEFFKDKDFEFSVNLSIVDIQSKEITKFIFNKLNEFTEPKRVVFEILETDKIENYEEMKTFIKEVKKYGCKVAIDDFGSGYSNFSHILELNVDCLKIDSSLVKLITTHENSQTIVKTIINFAKDLNLVTIAEFVEDRESLDLLDKMGVDFIQGYYIGKPDKNLIENF
ncbi:EAL domain-containing protein [Sulfurimonas sp.]|uniref:EAL domain-containing protein n=1 Tax=Sulfurimonas sp. TaxID=2022749 RepID=UPI0025F62E15|nr:EAL domain-containing protein [Sulfurimonas sp.]MCK9472933.1 EAL domain-containing protein [Sulfurimonas sp.]MDD3505015.1 EAL domain-containing protein [Sulfurimonas sp.]